MKLGNRIVDINAVTHASYIPAEINSSECVLSFPSQDDFQIFYDHEAEVIWQVLSDKAMDLTGAQVRKKVTEKID